MQAQKPGKAAGQKRAPGRAAGAAGTGGTPSRRVGTRCLGIMERLAEGVGNAGKGLQLADALMPLLQQPSSGRYTTWLQLLLVSAVCAAYKHCFIAAGLSNIHCLYSQVEYRTSTHTQRRGLNLEGSRFGLLSVCSILTTCIKSPHEVQLRHTLLWHDDACIGRPQAVLRL